MLKIQQHRPLLQRSILALCVSAGLGVGLSLMPFALAHAASPHSSQHESARQKRVIIFVWDGLRPDSVTATLTPNLARLQNEQGVHFTDHHSVYPTFTMMNAAALATGSYPGHHGFFGNTEYQPGVTGKNAKGKPVDFSQPFFTEDYQVLRDLDAFYMGRDNADLFLVSTLFQQAHRAGLKTAVVGKSGPAFLQDYKEDGSRGVILDENLAFPLNFAQRLQKEGYALPANIVNAYPSGSIVLTKNNGDPTASTKAMTLADKTTSDPRTALPSPHNAKNEYMMNIYLNSILPQNRPDLSLVWFRNPDSTEHTYGPGTPSYQNALASQDKLLGELLAKLDALHERQDTDLIVVSDHAHSTVAGNPKDFPLRALTGTANGQGDIDYQKTTDAAHGYAVSGDVRTADLLTRAGFPHVYDGNGCLYDPILSGILPDGKPLYPTQTDKTGSVCGVAGMKYTFASYLVPKDVPQDAVIIAANGGSDYLYVPNHDPKKVAALVKALQSRIQYGAVFVHSRYGNIPGTLSLKTIFNELPSHGKRQSPPNPDIIVSFDFDASAITAANHDVPGTEYESAQVNRGMHGSFSPRDVHNTLIAVGPDFRKGFRDELPTGNVDVAPTAAYLLGIDMPQAQGRVIHEALVHGGAASRYQVAEQATHSSVVKNLPLCQVTDLQCSSPVTGSYQFTLHRKVLMDTRTKQQYVYLDQAKAVRHP